MDEQRQREIIEAAERTIEAVAEQTAAWDAERAAIEADPVRWHDDIVRRRAAAAAPPVRRNEQAGRLLYRTHENEPAAPPDAATAAPMELLQATAEMLADLGGEFDLERIDRDHAVAELRREISELRGRIDVLVTLITKGGDVVHLPSKKSA